MTIERGTPRAVMALAILGVAVTAPAVDGAPGKRVLPAELTYELRLSVERGLSYLVRQQKKSGAFSARHPVACTSLAGLAFLASGHGARTGKYSRNFARAVDALLSYQQPSGYFDDGQSKMYGHGFATLFLAQAYGMSGSADERVRAALVKAVRLIERSQTIDGGWDYEPGLQGGDTSITVCQTMALRSARNLGIQVDDAVIARAKDHFIVRAQNKSDGGFRYRLKMSYGPGGESYFPRSAAGVCVLLSLGDYDAAATRRGFEYLLKHYDSWNLFPYYADYYCAQAMFQAGGQYWRRYLPYVRDKLLRKQERDGSWVGRHAEPEQATAMALVALQIPFQYLPITER